MEYLISFVPHAIAVVASVVSGVACYYFWNKYQKKTEELRAEEIRAKEIRAKKIRAKENRAEEIRTEEIRVQKIRADIINETKKTHIKILFVGPNGAGKSSLINTFISAMKNKRVKTAVARSCFVSNNKNFCDYYIEDNGEPIIALLDTGGFIVTRRNDNDTVLENIKMAFEGNLPYGQNMLEQVPDSDTRYMEPVDIVVFVYRANNILKDEWSFPRDLGYQKQYFALESLHKHVTEMNIANMLVLTHADCTQHINTEKLKTDIKKELGFDPSDIHLIKCLVDFQVTSDTNIPTAERVHALGVLYAITHDGVEKKKMRESRHRHRQTKSKNLCSHDDVGLTETGEI